MKARDYARMRKLADERGGSVQGKPKKPVAKVKKPMTPERAQKNEDERIVRALPFGRNVIIKNPAHEGGDDG